MVPNGGYLRNILLHRKEGNMRRYSVTMVVGLLIVVSAVPDKGLAQVTADDFLPVVQGGSPEVNQPDKVAVKGRVVTAATAQDAINAAVVDTKKAIKENNSPEVGARMVKFPSGLGYLATGMATYRAMENPTATRIAKRKAYVVAFSEAKKNLAEILSPTSNEGKDGVTELLRNVNRPNEETTVSSTQTEEIVRQQMEKMLRGFAVHQVEDDVNQNAVYVSIYTSPKTQGKATRPAPNTVEATTLRDGLNQVIAEVRTGVTFPVGGRTITMRSTGETAFVGFGSCVVRSSENSALQAKLNLTAQKIAEMRARDALCAMIRGDDVSSMAIAAERQTEESRDVDEIKVSDTSIPKDSTAAKTLDQARSTFLSQLGFEETIRSVRKNILPPGVTVKTWFDVDSDWAYGMAVYVPSLTNVAAKVSREMDNAQIVQPVDDGSDMSSGGEPHRRATFQKPSSGFVDEHNPNIARPGKQVKQGPTGKIVPE